LVDGAPPGARLRDNEAAVSLVVDPANSPYGTFSLSPRAVSGVEGTSVELSIVRDGGSVGGWRVSYRVEQTTSAGVSQVSPMSGSVDIAAGATTASIQLNFVDDNEDVSETQYEVLIDRLEVLDDGGQWGVNSTNSTGEERWRDGPYLSRLGNTELTVTNAASTVTATSASTSSDSAASTTVGLVIAVCLLLIIVAVVVYRRKGTHNFRNDGVFGSFVATASAPQEQVSFPNPMFQNPTHVDDPATTYSSVETGPYDNFDAPVYDAVPNSAYAEVVTGNASSNNYSELPADGYLNVDGSCENENDSVLVNPTYEAIISGENQPYEDPMSNASSQMVDDVAGTYSEL